MKKQDISNINSTFIISKVMTRKKKNMVLHNKHNGFETP